MTGSESASQPQREIDRVAVDVPQGLLLGLHSGSGRLTHKARTTESRVPVVVGKMMKSTLSDGGTSPDRRVECDRKVETLSCYFAFASCDHSSRFVVRNVDGAFMGMCWQERDCAARSVGVRQYWMYGANDRDFLKVSVSARVKIGPGDVG